jgi:hypothetical protein
LRDGGYAVALFDGISRDGEIAAIAADEGDIRTVKCSNKGQPARGGHGTREHGADGMRNRVVDVEEVQGFGFEHFQHFGREGQGVGRVIEERVAGNFDLVEMSVRVVGIHANRRGVADEMDIVAARGEFLTELSGDDAGAAVGGVAGYTDAHGAEVVLRWNDTGRNDTTK